MKATNLFHLPIDEEEDREIEGYQRKYLTWTSDQAAGTSQASSSKAPDLDTRSALSRAEDERNQTVNDILQNEDLYDVLGVDKSKALDKLALRRAYLVRSKACHPEYVLVFNSFVLKSTTGPIHSKFPVNKAANATLAFQKIAIAYDTLSKPQLRRIYDCRSRYAKYDIFAAGRTGHAEETFQGVVIGIFNDFLDGDLEVIRTLLSRWTLS